jgi:general secretion pathway protein J
MPLAGWELFYFRGDAWTNPLSAAGSASTGTTSTSTNTPSLPDGVRLVLQLPAGGVVAGRLQRDWVRPALTRSRS